MVNSVNVRIPKELHKIIEDTREILNPVSRKITGEDITYMATAKMIALKLTKYTQPFTDEVFQELKKVVEDRKKKENGRKS